MHTSLRSLLAAALVTSLSAGAAHGQLLNQSSYSPSQSVPRMDLRAFPAAPAKAQPYAKGAGVLALTWRTLDSLQNAFSYYSSGVQPLVYSPEADRLVTIHRGAHTTAENAEDNLDNIYIRYSDDLGQTWERIGPVDQNEDPGPARYPSVYAYTLAGDIIYAYVFPYLSGTEPSFGSLGLGAVVESSPSPVVIPDNGFTYQETSFTWGTGSEIISTADNSKLLIMGNPTPADGAPNTLYNTLALQLVDSELFTSTVVVPDAWAPSNFPDPGQPNFVTVTATGLDRDATGTLHLGVFGRFSDNPDGDLARTVGVSSSTDGENWSEFDLLPASVINAYSASLGVANPDSAGLSFTTDKAFITTGNGNYHFVMPFLDFRASIPAEQRVDHLVEVYKQNGEWGIRRVAERPLTDRSAVPLMIMANDEKPDSLSQSQKMSELQLAKTADGSTILAKWIDYRNNGQGTIYDENLFPYGDGFAPDTLFSTDIFVSARKVDGGNWTEEPVNLTDDVWLDRIVWMPKILPNDLMNVPILSVRAAQLPSETTEGQIIRGQHDVVSREQYILMSNFDASVAVGVEDNPTAADGMLLENIYPNPVAATADIRFTLPAAGHATVELHNAMGMKVTTLFDAMAPAGTQHVAVDTRDLASGTYYYTLKYNGATETRMLTVVR